MHKTLLVMRWVLLNLSIAVLLFVADRVGLIAAAWDGDLTWVTTGIVAVFATGWFGCAWRIAQCGDALDALDHGGCPKGLKIPTASWSREALRIKLASRLRPLAWLAYMLVTLGFLGTVWGLKVALAGVNVAAVGDVHSIGPMVSALIDGMGVAIWTTVTGLVSYLALSLNIRLIEGGYDRLYCKLLAAGGLSR